MNAKTKKEQRQILRNRLCSLSEKILAQKSRQASEIVINSDIFKQADCIMAYMPMAYELDPTEIIKAALKGKKIVAVPRIDWLNKTIYPVRIRSVTKGLLPDKYGIPTPIEIEDVDIMGIEFVLTPGLGYDYDCNRLGRGGGYYDKLLSDSRLNAFICGFAASEQILDSICVVVHDKKVDGVVTEKGCITNPATGIKLCRKELLPSQ